MKAKINRSMNYMAIYFLYFLQSFLTFREEYLFLSESKKSSIILIS